MCALFLDLRGLTSTGNCPECGAPVERSLRGDRLQYSAPEYLHSLHRGVWIAILITIIETALMIPLGIVVGILAAFSLGAASTITQFFVSGLSVVLSATLVYGWWLFSTPDPAILTENTGANARKLLRICAVISFLFLLVSTMMQGIVIIMPSLSFEAEIMAGVTGLLNGISGITLYFASLFYIRWLAPRVPDNKIHVQATRLMWLGPLIYILGFLCLMVGPLIALILYLLLLNKVRLAIRQIMDMQQPLNPMPS